MSCSDSKTCTKTMLRHRCSASRKGQVLKSTLGTGLKPVGLSARFMPWVVFCPHVHSQLLFLPTCSLRRAQYSLDLDLTEQGCPKWLWFSSLSNLGSRRGLTVKSEHAPSLPQLSQAILWQVTTGLSHNQIHYPRTTTRRRKAQHPLHRKHQCSPRVMKSSPEHIRCP